jgi:glucose-6-phosphate dehydrogenase assembly protein OpcA
MCDTLLVDSGSFRDDGRQGLKGLLKTVAAGHSVNDIGWARLSLWRELLASLFDHPLLIAELPGVRHLRLDVARPGSTMRISKAACFGGWLAALLGWTVSRPVREAGGDRFAGEFRVGRRTVTVEFRPAGAGSGPNVPGTGSLMRVDLELMRGRAQTRARVTRQADHLLATADWNGAQVARRAGRLEPFEETPFLAEALDRSMQDRVFQMALDRAVELVGRT